MPRVPRRLASLEPFLAMEILERAQVLERSGEHVVHLELGEPDFDPAPQVLEACRRAVAPGRTRYTDSRGRPELRHAIAADYLRRFGVSVDPDRILVTSGTSPAMLIAFSLLLEPGAEVIVPTPHYPCYPNFIRYCGGEPVFVPTHPEDGYRVDVEAVRRAVTARTAAIVVASPANPTGAVQSEATLRALAGLGLPLVSDEIYDGLVYFDLDTLNASDTPPESVSVSQIDEASIVLDGFSKRFAMTGFRLGWVLLPEWAARPAQILSQNLFISVASFVQEAGIAALEHGGSRLDEMRAVYRTRRDRMVAGLRELGFGVPRTPEGAFYVLADARRFGDDSRALAFDLLERAHVGTTPGVDFGAAAEGMLRFCYAVGEDEIDEGLARLAPVLAELAERRASAGSSA